MRYAHGMNQRYCVACWTWMPGTNHQTLTSTRTYRTRHMAQRHLARMQTYSANASGLFTYELVDQPAALPATRPLNESNQNVR